MKNKIQKYNLIIVMILATTMLTPLAVFAQEAENNSGNQTTLQERLSARNLAKCQNREKVMNNIITRIGDRGQKQINVISSIQQKVQNFYTDKEITVENYDTLMTTAAAKKEAAVTAMNNVRAMNGKISCTGDNPKGVATQFKSQAAAQSAATKEYRDAVHALAVSIKTALGDSQAAQEEN